MGLWNFVQKGLNALDARAKKQSIDAETRVIEEEDDPVYDDEEEEVLVGYQPELASPEYHKAVYHEHGVKPGTTHNSVVEDRLKRAVLTVGTLAIFVYLGYSQAQVFTGFRFPSLDFNVLMIGGICYVFESIGLVLLFESARNYREKKWLDAGVRFFFFAIIATFGFVSQLLLLNSELVRNILSFPDSALTGLYINQGMVFIGRGLLPAIGQVCLVFLIPDTKYDHKKKIKEDREHQEAIQELEQAQLEARRRQIKNDAMIALDESWAAFVTSKQQLLEQHYYPKQMLTYVHEPDRIPEQASSMQNAAPPQPQTAMPQNRAETPNRQPDRKKAVIAPPVQKNVRIASNSVAGAAPKAPEVKPEPQVARLADSDKLRVMAKIIQHNPAMTMGEIVDETANTFGGTRQAYHWYVKAKEYLEEEELPRAVNASAQNVPIVINPRDRLTLVEDVEDGGIEDMQGGQDDGDIPFPEGR